MIKSPPTPIGFALAVSEKIYQPESIARSIVNMVRPQDQPQTLQWAGAITSFDPHASDFAYRCDGIAYTENRDGGSQCLLVRSGSTLYRHAGWSRSWVPLWTECTYNSEQVYPDTMIPINGRVYWCNGIDQPLVVDTLVTSGRLVQQSTFNRAPAAPTVLSPIASSYETTTDNIPLPPNQAGYSIPGLIGSMSQVNGEDGNLLEGAWVYAVQWEDAFGNLSALSPASAPANMQQQSTGFLNQNNTDYVRVSHLDHLTRQFAVRSMDAGTDTVHAVRLYRSLDLKHLDDGELYLLARMEGQQAFTYPDNIPDARLRLSVPAQSPVVSAPYRVACEYQGRLITANFGANPGLLRYSEPGFCGTFLSSSWVIPDSASGEITGLTGWGGYLLAFTRSGCYRIRLDAEGVRVEPVSVSFGCVAPSSIQTLPDGRLIWLDQEGFVVMDSSWSISPSSNAIAMTTSFLNRARVGRAVSCVDPRTGLYLCSVTTSATLNDTTLAYDYQTNGWTSFKQNFSPTAMVAAGNRAGYTLMGGLLGGFSPTPHKVVVWNTASSLSYTELDAVWESVELRADPEGRQPFSVREIFVGFVESADSGPSTPGCTVRTYKGDRSTSASFDTAIDLIGQDYDPTWRLAALTVGSSFFRYPMVRWRRFAVGSIQNITGFKFSVTSSVPIQLVGFQLILDSGDTAGSRTPGPRR